MYYYYLRIIAFGGLSLSGGRAMNKLVKPIIVGGLITSTAILLSTHTEQPKQSSHDGLPATDEKIGKPVYGKPRDKGAEFANDNEPIIYIVTDSKNKKVAIAEVDGNGKHYNTLTLPAKVTNNGVTYQVTKVLPDATRNEDNEHFIDKLVISSGIESIGENAFYETGIKEVVIPSTVKNIEASSFEGNNITTVNIPKGVTTIDNEAFASNKVKTFSLPTTVKKISKTVFKNNPQAPPIKGTVTVHFKNTKGKKITGDQTTKVNLGSKVTLKGKNVNKYFPLSSSGVQKSVDTLNVEYTFKYKSISEFEAEAEKQIYTRLKAYRKQKHLRTLKEDKTLEKNSYTRTGEIVKNFSHDRPRGAKGNFTKKTLENIAMRSIDTTNGKAVGDQLFTQWKNSPMHNATMINKISTKVGIRVRYVQTNGGYDEIYGVQLFNLTGNYTRQ
jgi:uncharacterized protein YkwD